MASLSDFSLIFTAPRIMDYTSTQIKSETDPETSQILKVRCDTDFLLAWIVAFVRQRREKKGMFVAFSSENPR